MLPYDQKAFGLQYSSIEDLAAEVRLSPDLLPVLAEDYETYYKYLAPFSTAAARAMLPDLKKDVAKDPDNTKIVFVGRDGYMTAASLMGLDPVFYHRYCVVINTSRITTLAALADAERNGPLSPGDEPFRRTRFLPRTANPGDFGLLTKYLARQGVPLRKGGRVTIVDVACGAATTQDVFSILYKEVDFLGRYILSTPVAGSKNLEKKIGYVVDEKVPLIHPNGYPEQQRFMLASVGAQVLQGLLSGPYGTVRSFNDFGPVVWLEGPFGPGEDINPARISRPHLDPSLWVSSKVSALLAVYHHAQQHRYSKGLRNPSVIEGVEQEWEQIRQGLDKFTRMVGMWTFGRDSRIFDPKFYLLMDTYIPHPLERDDVKILRDAVTRSGSRSERCMKEWESLAELHDGGLGGLVPPTGGPPFRLEMTRNTGIRRSMHGWGAPARRVRERGERSSEPPAPPPGADRGKGFQLGMQISRDPS